MQEAMPFILTVALVLLAVAVVAAIWLAKHKTIAERARDEARADLAEAQTRMAELDKQLAGLESAHKHDEQRLKDFKEQIETHLKALTGEALKESRSQFIEQADEKLKPVREMLDRYAKAVTDMEKSRAKAYGELDKHLSMMAEGQKRLTQETHNLVSALRRPEVRGRWGEMQLRRVVELAGMSQHCDFDEQTNLSTAEGGRLRPDMVVHLPGGREIVVDAKTPLDAYIDSIEAQSPEARQQHLERHAQQVEAKVRELQSKAYTQQFSRTPDFVILFLPGESFLQAAAQIKPHLIEEAMEKGVVVATPSTLISLLHAVAIGWREERLADNARKISEQGQELHERLCTFAGHLGNLRLAIAKAVEHHDKAVGSLDRNVLPSVKRLEELHAQSSKKWPEEKLTQINAIPREPKSLPNDTTDENAA